MTISVDLGKFKATITHNESLCRRKREVELDVMWHSCGVYQVSYYRPRDAKPHYVIVEPDWYPPNVCISFTPEQFEKAWELFPSAPRQNRIDVYKPFYEDFDLDRGMFDMGHDSLFQASKDPHDDVEKVYLATRSFTHGAPDAEANVLGLEIGDFKRLKDLIDSKKGEIFYSGCKASFPADWMEPDKPKAEQ